MQLEHRHRLHYCKSWPCKVKFSFFSLNLTKVQCYNIWYMVMATWHFSLWGHEKQGGCHNLSKIVHSWIRDRSRASWLVWSHGVIWNDKKTGGGKRGTARITNDKAQHCCWKSGRISPQFQAFCIAGSALQAGKSCLTRESRKSKSSAI